MEEKKKVIEIDDAVCIACGRCTEEAEDYFHIVDGVSTVKKQYDEKDKDAIESAVANCPVDAIKIVEK